MPIQQRILVFVGAVAVFVFIVRNIKKSKILMSDAIFWVLLSVALLILAAFPQVVIDISSELGFLSPINAIFLATIALLVVKLFSCSMQISMLSHKVEELAQEIALSESDDTSNTQE